MQNLRNILAILADGRFHSGAVLATRLGLSRTAIWKQIRALQQQYSIPVQAVQGRGYRLPEPLELLEANAIRDDLPAPARALMGDLQVHWSLDSTNQWLMENRESSCGSVVVAEHQRRGRGRRGRDWVSPLAANLYFSLLWCYPGSLANLSGLSLAVAVSVVRALTGLGLDGLTLKWPNDILWQDKKLCGVLLEMQGEAGGPCRVVCGVGLNVNMPSPVASDIAQPWIDVRQICRQPVSRRQLLVALLTTLLPALDRYGQDGLASFLADWQRWDGVVGKPVRLLLPQHIVQGRAAGIDDQGNLIIENQGRRERYCSGEISLRFDTEPDHAVVD